MDLNSLPHVWIIEVKNWPALGNCEYMKILENMAGSPYSLFVRDLRVFELKHACVHVCTYMEVVLECGGWCYPPSGDLAQWLSPAVCKGILSAFSAYCYLFIYLFTYLEAQSCLHEGVSRRDPWAVLSSFIGGSSPMLAACGLGGRWEEEDERASRGRWYNLLSLGLVLSQRKAGASGLFSSSLRLWAEVSDWRYYRCEALFPSPMCGCDLCLGYSGLNASTHLWRVCLAAHEDQSEGTAACFDPDAHSVFMGESLWSLLECSFSYYLMGLMWKSRRISVWKNNTGLFRS